MSFKDVPQPVLTILWVLGFVVFWCAIGGLISLAGWRTLAGHFPATLKPDSGQNFQLQHGRIGSADYNGCLNVRVCREGLYMAVLPLFAFAHTPILVPWSNIGAGKIEKRFWIHSTSFPVQIAKFKTVAIAFDNRKLAEIVEAARSQSSSPQ